ncbi:MAG: adenosylcobinamide-GDP ribazoletransferase [Tannerellaceae bacterium]|jgi:adenosylcobinamide-GDP ribazoletransferase|nr:adenosylcobinamide-GDP ribazoletransferase [Tannerellaceae bacterium]
MKDIVAALLFFTRLPAGWFGWLEIPPESFAKVINYWAVTGWLTAGVMAGTLWLSSLVWPYPVAVALALLSRTLATGALHEDGLADFLDGFGGGRTKGRILDIMKDSHIGTYGVAGLLFYFLLLYLLLVFMPLSLACTMILVADPFCKLLSAQLVRLLPYARTAESSKSGCVYAKPSFRSALLSGVAGLLPLLLLPGIKWLILLPLPAILFSLLAWRMKRGIGGYTGDCCGAAFLLTELAFFLGVYLIN